MTEKILHRNIELETRKADAQTRTVPVVVSSEYPVDRGGYVEILSHAAGAIDLSRQPLPVQEGHDGGAVNIGLVENLRVDNGKLRGALTLGQSNRASELWPDIQAGIVRNVSAAYTIQDWTETEDPSGRTVLTATRWQPAEVSLVGVPADPTAGINRSRPMADEHHDDTPTEPHVVATNERQWLLNEKRRRQEVRRLFQPFATRGEDFELLEEAVLDDPMVSVDGARKQLFELLAGQPEPLSGEREQGRDSHFPPMPQITAGRDNLGDYLAAASDALLIRAGIPIKEPHPAVRDLNRESLVDMAETVLRRHGVATSGLNREQLIKRALSARGIIAGSSSDFPYLLENTANKAMMVGFMEAPTTHRAFVRVGSLPDFKQGRRVTLSDFDDLEVVYENGEYKYGYFGENYATVQLAKYGKLFSISWEAIVNDDTASFTKVPMGMAQAARRAEADTVYALLTGGDTSSVVMPDGNNLFDASNHGNYVASGSGAAPSVDTLDAGFVGMGTQTGPKGAHLNIQPRYLIVPLALKATSLALVRSVTDPAGATVGVTNPFQGELEVIADSRLDADSAAQWYLAADPNVTDTIELLYLAGSDTPFLEQQQGWTSDGVSFKVRHVFGATALDYRGLYCNVGA